MDTLYFYFLIFSAGPLHSTLPPNRFQQDEPAFDLLNTSVLSGLGPPESPPSHPPLNYPFFEAFPPPSQLTLFVTVLHYRELVLSSSDCRRPGA